MSRQPLCERRQAYSSHGRFPNVSETTLSSDDVLAAALVAVVSAQGFTAGRTCALQGLELAVPGTYIAGEPVVTIAAFAPQLHVITSKQRPRKLTIHGSDGAEYMFLLKASMILPLLPDMGLSTCSDGPQ